MNRKITTGLFFLSLLCCVNNIFSQTFTDVSSSAGTSFEHAAPANPLYMKMGTGAAWFDYNRDGHLDFYVTNRGAANKLFRNNGDGTFTDVAASLNVDDPTGDGAGVVIGDINNDGYQDIYLANGDEDKLFKNNDGLSFTDITTSAGLHVSGDSRGTSASFGDYDEDGYLDLYVAHHAPIPGSNNASTQDYLFYNNGDETFSNASGLFNVTDLSDGNFIGGWTDFDHDNDLDIIVVSDCPFGNLPNNGTRVFRNDGGNLNDPANDWTFTEVSSTVLDDCNHGMGLGIGDLNRDGWLDVSYSDIGPALLFQNNNGVFQDISTSAGINIQPADDYSWGTSFLDYNNDGWQDIIMAVGAMEVTNPQLQPNFLFENNGDNTFTDVAYGMGVDDSIRTRTIVHGDYDNDGDLDLVMVNYDSMVVLYRNDVVTTQNYFRIICEGTNSCYDGIGAKVKITTPDGVSQYFEIRSGSNLGGGDEVCAHFGISSNTTVNEVEVTWLSGGKNYLYNQAANQEITITESAVVPIELNYFEGKMINQNTYLDWQTSTEIDNDYFEIQRSNNGRKYMTIGKVKGKGASNSITDYSFIDRSPELGQNFYRLKQVDFDGSYEFSNVLSFKIERDQDYINVFPNPASGNSLNVKMKLNSQGLINTQLLNVNGEVVYENVINESYGENVEFEIPITNLSPGIYYLKVSNPNGIQSRKVFID